VACMQVASWVAQASFEPLGLTVAVAKDRAIESLMQVGDSFVLNCLGEAEYGPLMKVRCSRRSVDQPCCVSCGSVLLSEDTEHDIVSLETHLRCVCPEGCLQQS
jgi:hypothetical protein